MKARINFKGTDIDVEFDYQPGAKQTRNYPGDCAHVEEITEIKINGVCVYELLENQFDEIAEEIMKHITEEY